MDGVGHKFFAQNYRIGLWWVYQATLCCVFGVDVSLVWYVILHARYIIFI
jgi:hypothetical protein